MTATTAPDFRQIAPGAANQVRPGDLVGTQKAIFGLALVALIASLIGFFTSYKQFLFSYAVAYMFTLGIVLGALFFVMLQHITRAGWSVVVRRLAENMASVMPLMAVLFVPIAIGYRELFAPWAKAVLDSSQPGYDALVAHKQAYLNSTFFFIRAVVYFAVWVGLTRYYCGKSLEQDRTGDPAISLRLSRRAAPGILLFAMTVTFAAFDWIMSMDPHWFSTIFGVTYFAGGVMGFLATLALLTMWLRRHGYLKDVVTAEHYHDIGKLLFAFMVFWTYVNFSQYMLIWYANLPEETMWYQHRAHGNWPRIGQILIVGHFLAPFAFLMSRHVKRNRTTLAVAGVFLLVMHWFDMQFLIMPNHDSHGLHVTWLDVTTILAIPGLFLAFALRSTIRNPLVPARDPRLLESVRFHNL